MRYGGGEMSSERDEEEYQNGEFSKVVEFGDRESLI